MQYKNTTKYKVYLSDVCPGNLRKPDAVKSDLVPDYRLAVTPRQLL